jgi:hypothetical protein
MLSIQRLIKTFDNTDVGPHRPLGTSPIQRRGEATVVAGWDTGDYEAIDQNLEGLTTDIPDISIDEILRCYQRHTVGVSGSISRLLRRVAWEIVCYREQHP